MSTSGEEVLWKGPVLRQLRSGSNWQSLGGDVRKTFFCVKVRLSVPGNLCVEHFLVDELRMPNSKCKLQVLD